MIQYDTEEWRMSLCMIQYEENGNPKNFYRLANYEELGDDNFQRVWIDRNRRGNKFEDPYTLYNPYWLKRIDELGSDFIILKWQPHRNDQGESKPFVDSSSLPVKQKIKLSGLVEVLICDGVSSWSEFQAKLRDGIPFSGHPTPWILVGFPSDEDDASLEAVRLESSKLDYNNGFLSLKPRLDGNKPSADVYRLDYDNILDLPLQPYSERRYLYKSDMLPEPIGKKLIRPFEDYVADYVKWFYKKADVGLTQAKRREISSFVEEAFKAPESLEDVIGVPVSENEWADVVKVIQRSVHPEEDKMSKLITSVLENDEKFRNKCRQELLSWEDPEMKSLRDEVSKLARERDNTQSSLNVLRHEMETFRHAIDECRKAKSSSESELHDIEERKKQLLRRLEDDVALKLGLQTVVSYKTSQRVIMGAPSSLKLSSYAYADIDWSSLTFEKTLSKAFAANLRRLGLMNANDRSIGFMAFADGVVASLSATNMLAIDSAFAAVTANGLSVALSGQVAKHVSVPESYSDAEAILEQCTPNGRPVLVLDNVMDTLNEGLIFALSRLSTNAIIILPIGARGNLRLLAPEVWERVFYVPTENFACAPVHNLEKRKMCRTSDDWSPSKPGSSLYDDCSEIEPIKNIAPVASWYIPLAIADVIEKAEEGDDSEESLSADDWLCLHLLLIAYGNGGQTEIDNLLDSIGDSRWNTDAFVRRLAGSRGNG